MVCKTWAALNGQPVSLAFGINNQGQVVGIFEDFAGDNTTGFLWQDGVMTEVPPGGWLPGGPRSRSTPKPRNLAALLFKEVISPWVRCPTDVR